MNTDAGDLKVTRKGNGTVAQLVVPASYNETEVCDLLRNAGLPLELMVAADAPDLPDLRVGTKRITGMDAITDQLERLQETESGGMS